MTYRFQFNYLDTTFEMSGPDYVVLLDAIWRAVFAQPMANAKMDVVPTSDGLQVRLMHPNKRQLFLYPTNKTTLEQARTDYAYK